MVEKNRGLVLSAVELRDMTGWPEAVIEDYINNMDVLSELTAASGAYDPAGTAQAIMDVHEAAHPVPTNRDARNDAAGTAAAAITAHETPHPAPTNRDTRNEALGVAQTLLTAHETPHPVPTNRDARNEALGVAQVLLTAHETPHPAPTTRDARNQVAGSYEPAFSKNTGFNKNFGITGTEVAYGNHTHASSATILKGFLSGLECDPAADTDHDTTMAPGMCADSGGSVWMELVSAITKRIDAVWAVGTGNGGRASAVSLSANTTYHFFLITKADGTADAGWDTSLTATNLLADATGYIYYRRVMSIKTDASANIPQFTQRGNYFHLHEPTQTRARANITVTTAQTQTTSAPTGLDTITAHIQSMMSGETGSTKDFWGLLSSLSVTDIVPTSTIHNAQGRRRSSHSADVMNRNEVPLNSSAQFRSRWSATDTKIWWTVMFVAYTDTRDQ